MVKYEKKLQKAKKKIIDYIINLILSVKEKNPKKKLIRIKKNENLTTPYLNSLSGIQLKLLKEK